jgi:putative heme transporter
MTVATTRIRSRARCEHVGSASLDLAARPQPAMPATDTPTDDLALPTLDLRGLARRAAVPAAVAIVAVAAIVAAGGPVQEFAHAFGRALDADPRWVVAAAVFEVLSFVGYVSLLWLVGSRASDRLDFRASTQITLGGAAATRLLPTGGVGGAALTIWSFRRAGLGARGATRTLLSFLVLLYAVFLTSIALAGGAIALGLVDADGPLALSAVPATAAALAIGGGLALAAFARPLGPDAPAGTDAARTATPASRVAKVRSAAGDTPAALGTGIRDAFALLRSGDPRLLGALAWWGFDAAVLFAMLHALGTPPAFAVVVLGYFVGQVANTIPIPGAVSGGMVGVLLAFHVDPALAVAAVLAYRSVAIWLPAPIGLAALSGLRRTTGRWSAADAPETPETPEATPAERRPARRPVPLRPREAATAMQVAA